MSAAMSPNDYYVMLEEYQNTYDQDGQKYKRFTESLSSKVNTDAFNEHAQSVLSKCLGMLNTKTKQTSFAGFQRQFTNEEQSLVVRAKFLLHQLEWLTPGNQTLARAVGAELLRTIVNGYTFLDDVQPDNFFVDQKHIHDYIDNFIFYARARLDGRDKSGEWHQNEMVRFKSMITYALHNNLLQHMDASQRIHFFETVCTGNGIYGATRHAIKLFNPAHPTDKEIFNKCVDQETEDGKLLRWKGIIRNFISEEASASELEHFRNLLNDNHKWVMDIYYEHHKRDPAGNE